MSYTIVTAWYNVREKENHPLKSSEKNEFFVCEKDYFKSAKPFLEKPFFMVIYTEPRYIHLFLMARPKHLHKMTRFIFKDYKDLPLFDRFEEYQQSHREHPIHNLIQEKFTPLYKFIINQKVHFVKEVIERNPFNTEKFAWMDLRLHCVYDMSLEETNQAMELIAPNRVRLMQMSYTDPSEITNRHDYYYYTRGKLAAGFFGGEKAPLLKFADACIREFENALSQRLTPTDEMIYSVVVAQNTELFDPYIGEYGDCLKNLIRIRDSFHLVFPFLEHVFKIGKHSYTKSICNGLRRAYLQKYIDIDPEKVHRVWFYNYIAHYWLGEKVECIKILEEYYEISCIREDVKHHILSAHNFILDNIKYMNNKSLNEKFGGISRT